MWTLKIVAPFVAVMWYILSQSKDSGTFVLQMGIVTCHMPLLLEIFPIVFKLDVRSDSDPRLLPQSTPSPSYCSSGFFVRERLQHIRRNRENWSRKVACLTAFPLILIWFWLDRFRGKGCDICEANLACMHCHRYPPLVSQVHYMH